MTACQPTPTPLRASIGLRPAPTAIYASGNFLAGNSGYCKPASLSFTDLVLLAEPQARLESHFGRGWAQEWGFDDLEIAAGLLTFFFARLSWGSPVSLVAELRLRKRIGAAYSNTVIDRA